MRFNLTMSLGLLVLLVVSLKVFRLIISLNWNPEVSVIVIVVFVMAGAGLLVWLGQKAMDRDFKS